MIMIKFGFPAALRRLLTRLGLCLPPSVWYVGGSDRLPPPLSRQEEARCLAAAGEGDETARQTLIEHNLRLVVFLARRFDSPAAGLEDLISIGTIGLIKGINTFDRNKNIRLATYASRCIENEILMFLRKTTQQRTEVSFDEPLNTDWDGNELLLSDVLGTDPEAVTEPLEAEAENLLLRQAVGRLSPREKQIITLRFGLGHTRERTQKEVADLLGISQSYISRLEKRIIGRLRSELVRNM